MIYGFVLKVTNIWPKSLHQVELQLLLLQLLFEEFWPTSGWVRSPVDGRLILRIEDLQRSWGTSMRDRRKSSQMYCPARGANCNLAVWWMIRLRAVGFSIFRTVGQRAKVWELLIGADTILYGCINRLCNRIISDFFIPIQYSECCVCDCSGDTWLLMWNDSHFMTGMTTARERQT